MLHFSFELSLDKLFEFPFSCKLIVAGLVSDFVIIVIVIQVFEEDILALSLVDGFGGLSIFRLTFLID